MARFTDLSNELTMAIASQLPRTSDKLRLALVSHRIHALIISILYRQMVFNYERDKPKIVYGRISDTTQSMRNLARTLEDADPIYRVAIRSLDMTLDLDRGAIDFSIFNILHRIQWLKHLRLFLRGLVMGFRSDFSPANLGETLRHTSDTLETLVISVDGRQDRSDIGSLRHFRSLKLLCIQSHVLLGSDCPYGNVFTSSDDLNEQQNIEGPMVSGVLLLSLQELEVHCCESGVRSEAGYLDFDVKREIFRYSTLEDFTSIRSERPRNLQRVTICCPKEFSFRDRTRRKDWACDRIIEKLKARLDVTGIMTHYGDYESTKVRSYKSNCCRISLV